MAGVDGGVLLGERPGCVATFGSDATEAELSLSGSNTGATCMTALVRAERNAARTTSRNNVSSIRTV